MYAYDEPLYAKVKVWQYMVRLYFTSVHKTLRKTSEPRSCKSAGV